MKDRPFVYVIIGEDGDVVKAYYQLDDAVEYCQQALAEQLLDPRNWNRYFRIKGVQCE